MKRRHFINNVARWTAGVAVGAHCVDLSSWTAMAAEDAPKLVVTESTDIPKMVAAVMQGLGGMSRFVTKGARVVIKPNIGWDRKPEHAANTHPEVVKALAAMALDAGAAQVKVFDRTCNESRRCYINSGIQTALESMGDKRVKIEHIDDRKFTPVTIKNGKSIQEWDFYKEALDADCYINVPVAKHHGYTTLSLGLKNIMGVIGGRRGQIHPDIDQKLADLATVLTPQLTVIDATRMLLRNGPQGGNVKDVHIANTLLASTDTVAADAYAAKLFGIEPAAIGAVVKCHAMGIGEMDLNKVNVIKV